MKNTLLTTAIAAMLAIAGTTANAKVLEIAGVRVGNPFDSATWWDGATHEMGETVVINFADPDFWMSIPDPATHSSLHGAFTNPETWGQMLKFETYANMMDRDIWMKWADLETYDVLRDPQTFAYFMQPGAFQHLLNVEHYSQLANPAAHRANVDAALSNFGLDLGDITGALKLSALFGGADAAVVGPNPDVAPEN